MRLIPLFVFAGLALLLFVALGRGQEPAQDHWLGRALPPLRAIPLGATDAEPITLPKGSPVMINLFASWCTPCLAEHPQLKTLAKEHGVTIIGIAWNDSEAKIQAFLSEHGNPYARVYRDESGETAVPLGIHGIPESYLIGADGRVLAHIAGPITEEGVRDEILPALGGAK